MNTFRVKNENGVSRLTLDNPPINTITAELIRELNEYLNELRNDSVTKMVIFQSDNPLFFSSHLDLNVINGSESGVQACNEFAQLIANVRQLDQLTVALVDGVARGGACELAMACDLVFATENAVLAQPEASVNIPPGGQGSVQFARRMGKGKGLYWLLTGADIGAKQAEALNIITQYVPSNELPQFVAQLCSVIQFRRLDDIRMFKELVSVSSNDENAGIELETKYFLARAKEEMTQHVIRAYLKVGGQTEREATDIPGLLSDTGAELMK